MEERRKRKGDEEQEKREYGCAEERCGRRQDSGENRESTERRV